MLVERAPPVCCDPPAVCEGEPVFEPDAPAPDEIPLFVGAGDAPDALPEATEDGEAAADEPGGATAATAATDAHFAAELVDASPSL